MKRIVMICAAILLMAEGVAAVPVDAYAPNEIAAIEWDDVLTIYVLRTNGEVWVMSRGSMTWNRYEEIEPPVPVSDIVEWGNRIIFTKSGTCLKYNAPEGWLTVPNLPWGVPPVSIDDRSMGDVKQMFR